MSLSNGAVSGLRRVVAAAAAPRASAATAAGAARSVAAASSRSGGGGAVAAAAARAEASSSSSSVSSAVARAVVASAAARSSAMRVTQAVRCASNEAGWDDEFKAMRTQYEGTDASSSPEAVQAELSELVKASPVVLFMKGVPAAPRCGFSQRVAMILEAEGVPADKLTAVDILSAEQGHLREAVKQFSEWPTLPQLYIGGEFVGGADIVYSMHQEGELAPLLTEAGAIASA